MPSFRSREVTVAITGLALVAALSATVTILSPPADERFPSGSSFSHDPRGSAAAYQTLEKLGYRIRRSFEPVATLSLDPASTVLIVADPTEPASNSDRRALQAIVSAGATVLVSGCVGKTFLLDHPVMEGLSDLEPQTATARFPSPLTSGARQIAMLPGCGTTLSEPRFARLFEKDDGGAVVRFARIGSGLAVWWAGNTPLANETIDRPGHLELLLNLTGAPGKSILWDEFYHGQRRSLYSYAKSTPLPWFAAQAMLVVAVAGVMYARRRAPVLDRYVEVRTSPLEFVETMAGLYSRAGTAADAVQAARARLRRLLLAATGLAVTVDDAQLAAAAAPRLRLDPEALAAALAAAGRGSSVDGPAALPIVRRLQEFAAAADHGGD